MEDESVFTEVGWGSFSSEVPRDLSFYNWGGYTVNRTEELTRRVNAYTSSRLHKNISMAMHQICTSGLGPGGLYGGAAAYSLPHLYSYGGEDDFDYFGTLHRLKLNSKQWCEAASFDPNGPMKKSASGMVSFRSKLILFGGFGLPNAVLQPGSKWVQARGHSSGWTNEIHSFNLEEATWSSLVIEGERPPPCGSFSFNMIDKSRAVLFGGKQPSRMSDDVFVFDFNKMTCEKVIIKGSRPGKRAGHSAVCLGYNSRYPHILVTGGLASNGQVLDDVWILDLNAWRWIKLSNFGLKNARFYHCSAVFCYEDDAEVLLIGGCCQYDRTFQTNEEFPHARRIIRLELGKKSDATDVTLWKLKKDPSPILDIISSEIEINDTTELDPGGAEVNHHESVADNAAKGHITDEEKKEVKLNTADKLQKEVKEVSNGSTVNSEALAPTDNQENGIQDLDAGFENFSEDITEALFYDKKLIRNIANINIVGLPEGGKTCLLHRLINRTVKENLPSTGVCDATIMVDVAPASIFLEACPVDKDVWVVVDSKESFVKQVGECKRSQSSGMDPNSKEGSLEMTEESPRGADISVAKAIKNASSTIKGFRLSHHKKLQENVKSVLQTHNLKNFHDLKNFRSIYLRDTGGQLEFQESLSLLICGPSMVLFVFNASIDIDTPQPIKYRMDGRVITEFNSRISTKDALLQCLASVFATHVSRSVEAVVYIVGTHVDKLKNPDEEVEQIDEKIKEIVELTKFSDMVKYCNPTQLRMIYTVNNFATSDADFQEIRDHISKVLLTVNFTVKYPVSYLLFSLDILGMNKKIINLKDCEAIAAKYNITSQVIPDLLQFLNDKTGIIQWYNIPGLRNLIIKEPQIFYNKITNLIINTFSSPDLHSLPISVVKEMQCKGLFEASLFNKLIKEDDEFPPKQFVRFLTHLRMVAVYQDESGDEKYFIPCILKRAPEPPADSDLISPIRVLSFAFKCGHCPKGLFSNLIAHLIMFNKEKKEARVFLLQKEKVFRDQVSFLVSLEEEQDEITFKMLSSHLEVHFFPEESDDRDSLNGICIKIRKLLERLIIESLTNLKYDAERVGVEVCLSCSECISLGRHVVKVRKDETGYIHSCNRKKLSKLAPWFLEKETSLSNLPASSSELSIDDVEIVREEIWNARSKWYHIGLTLLLPSGTLDAIKRNATGVDDQCTEMLQEWLRSGANKTWENLAEVMKSKTIGHFDISRMIRDKFCP